MLLLLGVFSHIAACSFYAASVASASSYQHHWVGAVFDSADDASVRRGHRVSLLYLFHSVSHCVCSMCVVPMWVHCGFTPSLGKPGAPSLNASRRA